MGTTTDSKFAVIVGSVREGRFGDRVGPWVHETLLESGLETDIIDLADFDVPLDMTAHSDISAFTERIDRADAVVVITPEYNHSYPGPLKSAIDAVRQEWQAKPVAFVSYGGMSGGLRAVEALRLVFAELHAVTVRDSVSLHNPWSSAADPDVDFPGTAATDALRRMTAQLRWWAEALRTARLRTPYPT